MTKQTSLTLWRISNYPDLSGKGGLEAEGRWHSRGWKVAYLADSSTGALLEVLVHLQIEGDDLPDSFMLLRISIPNSMRVLELAPPPGEDWKSDEALTRKIGDEWLASKTTALARVPSSIVTGAWNYLLNPDHPDAGNVEIVSVTREKYDRRLFRLGPRLSK
jgi:RES domain-containing protein